MLSALTLKIDNFQLFLYLGVGIVIKFILKYVDLFGCEFDGDHCLLLVNQEHVLPQKSPFFNRFQYSLVVRTERWGDIGLQRFRSDRKEECTAG